MKIPTGMTEDEVVATMNNVVNRLARKFIFGCYDIDEIKQIGRQYAIEAMPRYNEQLPLENFLWTHVHNRLCNFKRNKYERLAKPCKACSETPDNSKCPKCIKQSRRNDSKKNLMKPIGIDETAMDGESNMYTASDVATKIADNEILDIIDREISIAARPVLIKLKNGIKISKAEHKLLLAEIRSISAIEELMDDNTNW